MLQKTAKSRTSNLILCGIFSALIALGAFIKIPIPFVPFTLQFLFTSLAGLLLGPRLGSLAVGVYIGIGLLGIPVFTNGGGFGYIVQPTFGYLLGFYVGTYATGTIATASHTPSFWRLLLANFAGLLLVYLIGMIYYYVIANYYINQPLGVWALTLYCFLLPIPGDLAICLSSALLAKRLIPIFKKGVQ